VSSSEPEERKADPIDSRTYVGSVGLSINVSSSFALSEAIGVQRGASLLLQTVIVPGERTPEGHLIEAVTLPWFEIIAAIGRDPNTAFQIAPRKWEEIIAGAYHKAGFDEVILTPSSGDLGRDVIATKKGLGTVRVIDQVKAYSPDHLVTADDVRALLGVLPGDGASKGFLTTTSDFAPRLREDPLISFHVPARLELINGEALLKRLKELAVSR
jgi:restriction system protein